MIKSVVGVTISMFLFLMLSGYLFAGYYQLPDTGRYKCFDKDSEITCPSQGQPFYGQDAQYFGPQPSYKDNGDGTVTDFNTGLMWQQSDDGIKRQWQAAIDYCENLELPEGGYTDWRLPDRRELVSIVDYSRYQPPIDPVFDSTLDTFWSNSTYAPHYNYRWTVSFSQAGHVSYQNITIRSFCARCVRAGSVSTSAFQDNGNGTISDTVTDLMWQKADDGVKRNWEAALDYCEDLELPEGGYTDWRLPNVRELESIVDWDRYEPAIDPVFDYSSPSSYYWSSTNTFNPEAAWAFYSNDGVVSGLGAKYNIGYLNITVRCVRGGPVLPPSEPQYYALLVGCGDGKDDWTDWGISDEEVVANDVDLMKQILKSSSPKWINDNFEILKNEEVSSLSIFEAMERIATKMDDNDSFLLFLSGHGNSTGFSIWSGPHISPNELNTWLTSSGIPDKAQKIILLQACFSGQFVDYYIQNPRDNLYVMTSTGTYTTSLGRPWIVGWTYWEDVTLFTHLIGQAIDGGGDKDESLTVTFDETFDFVQAGMILGTIFSHPQRYPKKESENIDQSEDANNKTFLSLDRSESPILTEGVKPVTTIPSIGFTSPENDITVKAGDTVRITWSDNDSDDNANISLARDPDDIDKPWATGTHNWLSGNALILKEDDQGASGHYDWDTANVPPGKYIIWAMIYDGNHTERFDRAQGSITVASPKVYVNMNDEKCSGNAPCHSTIQEAIDKSANWTEIKIANGNYSESATLKESKTLTLQGGWDSNFRTQISNTTFIKAPKAQQGSLTLQMLTVKP